MSLYLHHLIVVLGLLVAGATPRPAAPPAEEESIVAVVGDRPITVGDVLEEQAQTGRTFAAAREDLIRRHLLVLEGERLLAENESLRLRVNQEVEVRLREQSRKVGGEQRLRELLRSQGLNRQWLEEQVRRGVLGQLVLSRYVWQGPGPSPEEIREYYERHRSEFLRPRAVAYRQIFLPGRVGENNGAARTAARAQAAEIYARLRAGEAFARLATEHPRDKRANEDGIWPPGEWGDKDENLRRVILALQEGEYSPPVESEEGIYLFYAEKVLPENVADFAEVEAVIRRRLEAEAEQQREARLLRDLEQRYYVRRWAP